MNDKIKEPKASIDWSAPEFQDVILYEVSDSLQRVLDKVSTEDLTELSAREIKLWLDHFCYVVSKQYTLTPQQLVTSHDKWLVTIELQNDIEDKLIAFNEIVRSDDFKSWDLIKFLDFVVKFFTFEELAVFDINHTA